MVAVSDFRLIRVAVSRAELDDTDSACVIYSWFDPPQAFEPVVGTPRSLEDVWQFVSLHGFPRAEVEFADACREALQAGVSGQA